MLHNRGSVVSATAVFEQENEYAGAADAAPVVLVEEAERYVEGLREFPLEEIGGGRYVIRITMRNIEISKSS